MTDPRQPTSHIKPFGLRLQPELKDALEKSAAAEGRSLNAEIVRRLENSTETWPKLRPDIWQSVAESAKTNGISFAQQVERDLHFAHNPTYLLLADIVGSASIRKSIEETAAQRGVTFDQELLARFNLPSSNPVVNEATATSVALEYLQVRQAFEAREVQVKAIQAAFEAAKSAGTATEQDRIDAWNAGAELIYLRRAFEGLRERFFAHYRTDPRVRDALGQHRSADSAADS